VPQLAIRPGGATYKIKPDQDIIIVEITSEKLVKLRRLNFCLPIVVESKTRIDDNRHKNNNSY
jgi:hypothetical protein